MTLLEIAAEYRKQERRLQTRIRTLRRQEKDCTQQQLISLNRRINELIALKRETRELAMLLEHYYERGYNKRGKYTL